MLIDSALRGAVGRGHRQGQDGVDRSHDRRVGRSGAFAANAHIYWAFQGAHLAWRRFSPALMAEDWSAQVVLQCPKSRTFSVPFCVPPTVPPTPRGRGTVLQAAPSPRIGRPGSRSCPRRPPSGISTSALKL
jgi:hypothetical protein